MRLGSLHVRGGRRPLGAGAFLEWRDRGLGYVVPQVGVFLPGGWGLAVYWRQAKP